jgi:hypothetical protein
VSAKWEYVAAEPEYSVQIVTFRMTLQTRYSGTRYLNPPRCCLQIVDGGGSFALFSARYGFLCSGYRCFVRPA